MRRLLHPVALLAAWTACSATQPERDPTVSPPTDDTVAPEDPAPKPGTGCTKKGCEDQLAVHVTAMAGIDHLLSFEADGKRLHCRYVPDDHGQVAPLAPDACEGDSELALVLPSDPRFAPPNGVTPKLTILVQGAPAKATLHIVAGRSDVVGPTELAPTYTTVTPNGPACGPVCKQAVVVVP